jgi:hypothetical protein
MAEKKPIYNDLPQFLERLKTQVDFVKTLKSEKPPRFTVAISSSTDSKGRRILYRMNADARNNGYTCAKYQDNPPRVHDVEDGQLDIDGETSEFRDYVSQCLTDRGMTNKVNGLEIALENQ